MKAYAVLKDGNFARQWSVDPSDVEFAFADGEQVFGRDEAEEIAHQHGGAVVELHFCPTLFDLDGPRLIRHGDWLSNGFVLTRAFELELDDRRITHLIQAIGASTLERLVRVAMCPPSELAQGDVMHVFAPESWGGEYRDRADSLVCVAERYLEQMQPNWDDGELYLATGNQMAGGIVALYVGRELYGACMPLHTLGKADQVVAAVDWVRGEEW